MTSLDSDPQSHLSLSGIATCANAEAGASSGYMKRSEESPMLLTRRADFEPATFDEAGRTIEVVFSTGAEVLRYDFEGSYFERLDMTAEAVDLSQLRGAPVLNNHDRFSGVEAVLGVVETASVDGTRGVARLRFGQRPEIQGIVADIRGGIIRSVSAGYSVERWETTKRADGARVKTAKRWTPKEISFTPMGADPKAKTRSHHMHEDQIRSIAAAVGVPAAFADELIQRGAPIEDARAAIVREAARSVPPIDGRAAATVTRETSPEQLTRAAADALLVRVNPSHQPEAPELTRGFLGRRFSDIARELLRVRGQNVMGADAEILTRSLQTTSDLANIVGTFANKTAAVAYQAAPAGVRNVFRQGPPHADFKGRNIIRRGEMPALEKINEKGEVKRGGVIDGRESYAIGSYAKSFGVTFQTLVNDDLGLLADVAAGWGLAAAEWQNGFLVDLLSANAGGGPKLADAKNLFHADHANLAGSGAVISDTTLSAARLAMRTMKGLNGTVAINVVPRYLLVPAALETAAEKYLATIYPAQAAQVNPFGGNNRLELIVDPRLDAKSATRWYVFADPAQLPSLEYAFLSGYEGLQVESRNGFDVLGVEIRAVMHFGAGGVDHRGAFMNPGA